MNLNSCMKCGSLVDPNIDPLFHRSVEAFNLNKLYGTFFKDGGGERAYTFYYNGKEYEYIDLCFHCRKIAVELQLRTIIELLDYKP